MQEGVSFKSAFTDCADFLLLIGCRFICHVLLLSGQGLNEIFFWKSTGKVGNEDDIFV